MAVIGLSAGPAAAHDPIFVDDTTGADASPRILDGSVSFATYGVIDEPGATAYLRVDLADGDELVVGLLVPDEPPPRTSETTTPTCPSTSPTRPGRSPRSPPPPRSARSRSRSPRPPTSRLIDRTTPAVAGTYLLAVSSEIPTRFTLATGRTEQFGTPVERSSAQPLSALDAWYTTPPPTTSAPVSPRRRPGPRAPLRPPPRPSTRIRPKRHRTPATPAPACSWPAASCWRWQPAHWWCCGEGGPRPGSTDHGSEVVWPSDPVPDGIDHLIGDVPRPCWRFLLM